MALYEVSGPGGSIYHFEGPDNADPSAVIRQITGPLQSPSSAVSQAAQPNTDSDLLSKIALGGRAVGEGVIDTLALPNTISTAVGNLMRRGSNAILGTHLPMV